MLPVDSRSLLGNHQTSRCSSWATADAYYHTSRCIISHLLYLPILHIDSQSLLGSHQETMFQVCLSNSGCLLPHVSKHYISHYLMNLPILPVVKPARYDTLDVCLSNSRCTLHTSRDALSLIITNVIRILIYVSPVDSSSLIHQETMVSMYRVCLRNSGCTRLDALSLAISVISNVIRISISRRFLVAAGKPPRL